MFIISIIIIIIIIFHDYNLTSKNSSPEYISKNKVKKTGRKKKIRKDGIDMKNLSFPTLIVHNDYPTSTFNTAFHCPYCNNSSSASINPYSKTKNKCNDCYKYYYTHLSESKYTQMTGRNGGYVVVALPIEFVEWNEAWKIVQSNDLDDYQLLNNAINGGDYNTVINIAKKHGILKQWQNFKKIL